MYTYIQRANYKIKDKMRQLVDFLNESNEDDFHKYSLIKSKSSYNIKVEFDDGINQFIDYASIVKCDDCGELRELFDGQIEFCYHCDKDW